MKNREQLWEDYEEARFALLMDTLAEAEGEEALRVLPTCAVMATSIAPR